MTAADRLARVLQRLAETQRNLPVSLTDEEREDLRHAAHLLAGPPYKDPEWLPQSRVDCYRFGWETAAAALAPKRHAKDWPAAAVPSSPAQDPD